MSNLANSASGAEVLMASSYDERHPPEAILDSDTRTFWATTGLYPQEFVLKLGTLSQVSRIKILTTNARRIVIERTDSHSPGNWEMLSSIDPAESDGRLQSESRDVGRASCTFLKFTIAGGWQDFVTVHNVAVEGHRM